MKERNPKVQLKRKIRRFRGKFKQKNREKEDNNKPTITIKLLNKKQADHDQ